MVVSKTPTLVLASASPRRQELIKMLGFPVHIQPSHTDEQIEGRHEPWQVVEKLAMRKATSVAKVGLGSLENAIVIGSDTVVVLDGNILGKPADEEDAFRMLKLLQGREHEVYTGLACVSKMACRSNVKSEKVQRNVHGKTDGKSEITDTIIPFGEIGQYRVCSESSGGDFQMMVGHTMSKVKFRQLSDEAIKAYVHTGEPLDKAGAYGVQGIGSVHIEKIEGDFYSIMGLPLNLLYQMLLEFGIRRPVQTKYK